MAIRTGKAWILADCIEQSPCCLTLGCEVSRKELTDTEFSEIIFKKLLTYSDWCMHFCEHGVFQETTLNIKTLSVKAFIVHILHERLLWTLKYFTNMLLSILIEILVVRIQCFNCVRVFGRDVGKKLIKWGKFPLNWNFLSSCPCGRILEVCLSAILIATLRKIQIYKKC
jgi:hypothetical protein